MTPADIEAKEFSTRFKGYDPDEVDAFLDRVVVELRSALDGLKSRDDELVRLRRDLAEARRIASDTPTQELTPSASATRVLEAAQKTADDVVADAQRQAAGIIADAQTKATEAIATATHEAVAKRQRAEVAAYEAENRVAQLRDKHEQLRTFLKSHLESGLEGLNANG